MMRLLEREQQVAAVAGYLAEAAKGHGRMVFVAGEAGVGKTSFVGRTVADAADLARVTLGGCDGSSTPAPLGPLVEMLPRLPAEIWPPGAARHEVFARLVAALAQPRQHEPYLLVVEDAHWADEATLDLVRHLARRIHHCRALVLVTYRPEDLAAGHPLRVVLGDAATAPGVRRLDLPELSRSAVQLLAAEHACAHPGAAPADVDRLHRVTGGNPFFVTEVLSGGTGEVPATVRDAVQARVARLSAPARAALDVVALFGARAEVDLLDTVLDDGLAVLDEPLQRGLLSAGAGAGAGEVTFRQELARLAVAVPVPTFRRIAIHRRILGALLAREPGAEVDPARVAHHAEAAGVAEAVLAHAPEAAARAAELGSHREAVRQYQRTLRFADRLLDGPRADLLWALGYECYLTDQVEEALAAVEAALAIWEAAGDTVRVGDAYRCLSRLNWFAGRNDVAERQADLAVDSLQGSETVELAMAYSNVAQLRMLSSDVDGTRVWGGRALAALEHLPDGQKRDEVTVHALNNLGTAEVVSGDFDAGIRMLTSSLDQARAGDLQEHAARAYCNLVSCAVVQRRHIDAATRLEAGLEYCIDRDLDAWTLYLQGLQAQLLLNRGQTAAARQCAEKVLQRTESAPTSQVEPLVVLAVAAARDGDPGWREPVGRAIRLAEGIGEIQRVGPVTAARCEMAWLAGETDTPGRLAAETWPKATAADCPWNRGSIATWLGDPAAGDGAPLAPPYALEVSGRWVEASALWQQLGCPYEQALALARSNDRAAVTEAVELFDALRASGAAARARSLLRARGWSVPRAARAGTRQHQAGLTPRQAQVLALLTEGMPDAAIADRLVLSRRTVEHHVAAILTKLGVKSRRDAAALQLGTTQLGTTQLGTTGVPNR
jgi:predicted ATPase/DNA-binding CsgD family transcriptional regulator